MLKVAPHELFHSCLCLTAGFLGCFLSRLLATPPPAFPVLPPPSLSPSLSHSLSMRDLVALKRGTPAILAENGNTIVQGCDFQEAKSQLSVGSMAKKTVFANNLGPGKLDIIGAGAASVKRAANAFDS